MPCIQVHLLKGATPDQKRALIHEFSGALTRILGTAPEYIHVIFDEVEPTDWGYAGKPTSDLFPARAAANKAPAPAGVRQADDAPRV
jgi:4-oxalocrotonate tautomerase